MLINNVCKNVWCYASKVSFSNRATDVESTFSLLNGKRFNYQRSQGRVLWLESQRCIINRAWFRKGISSPNFLLVFVELIWPSSGLILHNPYSVL